MSLSDQEILELHELLDALVENNLAGERRKRLEEWLAESDAARRHYVRFMDMSSSLCSYAEERLSGEDDEGVVPFEPESGKLVRFFRPLAVAAGIAVVGFFGYKSYLSSNSPNLIAEKPSVENPEVSVASSFALTSDTVGVLTRAAGLEWDEDSDYRPLPNEPLRAGRLKLNAGLAQIEFLQGANVVLEGPVEFELTGPNEGALVLGKLRANVPKVAQGFSIDTPKGKVVDLGTEFGLNVEQDGVTEIYVYVGKVLFEGKDRDAELAFEELEAGEAVFVDKKGNLTWIDMPSEPFFGTADLAYRSMEESQRRHSAWVELSEELAADPRNSLYFTFDDHRSWSRILRDDAQSQKERHDGAIVGCKWSEGRWPGKGALSFAGENDRVNIKLPKRLRSATFATWVRLKELGSVMNPILCSPITNPTTASLGAACWGIDGTGRIVLRAKGTDSLIQYVSSVAFRKERIGQWTHLATTYDADNKMVSHYVDGRPFSREKMQVDLKLFFGKSALGHNGGQLKGKRGHGLRGSIDEFFVFNEAFDEEEVRRLYEIGRPYALPPRLAPVLP
jgi:hypothetical protein